MASVGGVSADFVKGRLSSIKVELEVYRTPGLNGYGAMQLGSADSPFVFQAVKYGSESTINTFRTDLEALQGSIQTIVDDRARSHTRCMIQRVQVASIVPEIGNGGYRIEVAVSGVQVQS